MKTMIRRSAAVLFAVIVLLAVWAIAGAHSSNFGAAPVHAGNKWLVQFFANNGTGQSLGIAIEENTYMTVPDNDFEPAEGMEFDYWEFNGGKYYPGDEAYITTYSEFYAHWKPASYYTITFENNGHGKKPDDQTVLYWDKLTEPKLSEDGWVFMGWYKDPECTFGNWWFFEDDHVRRSITLYAKWAKAIKSLDFEAASPVEGGAFEPIEDISTEGCAIIRQWLLEGQSSQAMSPFNKDQCYEVRFYFKAKDGYEFDRDAKVTINGKTDVTSQVDYDSDSDMLYVSYKFHWLKDADVTLPKTTYPYTPGGVRPEPVVKHDGKVLKKNVDYTVLYENNNGVNPATIRIDGIGQYVGFFQRQFNITKGINPMSVSGKTVTVKYAKLKKKAQTIKKSKSLKLSGNQGKVTYKLSSVTKSKFKKYFKVKSSDGTITVKKGLKKGTYKVKIKVKDAGNNLFNSLTKTVTVKVKVK